MRSIFDTVAWLILVVSISAGSAAQTQVPTLNDLWQVSISDDKAVAAFIEKHSGQPLVEAVPGRPHERRVTFYVLADKDTDYVMYSGGPDFGGLVMQPLAATQLWFVTIGIADDARYRYNFSHYKRLKVATDNSVKPRDVVRTDDIVLEMPNAPRSPYIAAHADVAKGSLKKYALASKYMAQDRDISVYTPAAYTGEVAHKLVIFFDGGSYSAPANAGKPSQGWVPTPTILDNLIAKGKIAPTIAIFVANMGTRNRDLPTDAFGDFIADELVSWARGNFAILPSAEDVILAGSSRGGYAAALIAFRHSGTIGNVLSLSGSYWINDKTVKAEADKTPFQFHRLRYPRTDGKMIKLYKASPQLPVRFYMTVGMYDLSVAMVGSNRQLRDILETKGYDVAYSEFSGGHDYLSWRGLLADGLLVLVGR